jgi:hypothetical protein
MGIVPRLLAAMSVSKSQVRHDEDNLMKVPLLA